MILLQRIAAFKQYVGWILWHLAHSRHGMRLSERHTLQALTHPPVVKLHTALFGWTFDLRSNPPESNLLWITSSYKGSINNMGTYSDVMDKTRCCGPPIVSIQFQYIGSMLHFFVRAWRRAKCELQLGSRSPRLAPGRSQRFLASLTCRKSWSPRPQSANSFATPGNS